MRSDKMRGTATSEIRFFCFFEPHCVSWLAWVNPCEFAMGAHWFTISNTGQWTQNSVFPNCFSHLRASLKSLLSGLEGACRPGVAAQRMCCFPKGFHGSGCDSFHGRLEIVRNIHSSVMWRSAETVILVRFYADSLLAWNHFYVLFFSERRKRLVS